MDCCTAELLTEINYGHTSVMICKCNDVHMVNVVIPACSSY